MQMRDNSWKHTKAGIIIAIINLIMIVNATWYFLLIADYPVVGWLCFNICTPSVVFFLTGFVLKRFEIMTASVPFLLFFGGGGLFIFGWQGSMLFAQAGHCAMVAGSIYVTYLVIREKRWKNTIISLMIGIIILIILLPFQQGFITDHPDLLRKLGDPDFEQFIKEDKERQIHAFNRCILHGSPIIGEDITVLPRTGIAHSRLHR